MKPTTRDAEGRTVVKVCGETFTLTGDVETYARLAMGAVASGDLAKARRFTVRGAMLRDSMTTSAEHASWWRAFAEHRTAQPDEREEDR